MDEPDLLVNVAHEKNNRIRVEIQQLRGGRFCPFATFWGTDLKHQNEDLVVLDDEEEVAFIKKWGIIEILIDGKKAPINNIPHHKSYKLVQRFTVLERKRGKIYPISNHGNPIFSSITQAVAYVYENESQHDLFISKIYELPNKLNTTNQE